MFGKGTVKSPVMKGVAKVPVVMQLEALECGAASLTMVLGYFGKWIPLEQVRRDCGVSRDGSNALCVLKAARNYGLIAKAYRLEPEDLLKEGPYPCILHWGFNHFVVLDGFRGRQAVINDPARGRVTVSWEEFDEQFTGVCMTFEPSETFEPSGKRKSGFDFAKERLKGNGAAMAFVVLTTAITSLIGIIQPAFNRVFLDRLLPGTNPEWLRPFLIGVGIFALIEIAASWVNVIFSTRIMGKMAAVGYSSYMWHVLRLPMHFFSQRLTGDIANRQQTNGDIAGVMVNTLAPLFLQAAMLIFYLAVMLNYSPLLTLIGVGSIVVDAGISAIISSKRVNITRVLLRDEGKLNGATVSGISMIETVKASGAEEGYFGRWAGFQASVNTQNMKFDKLDQYYGLIPMAITSIADLAVLGIGISLVIRGEFTVGMVMAFQGFLASFLSPAAAMLEAGQSIQEMVTQMERVEDVLNYPVDTCFENGTENKHYEKLSGQVEINNISFGYAPLGDPLIKNFSMVVKPGSRVAFVGPSGCGKSTLAKLISGLYQPWEGSITFDGKPIADIDRKVFTGSVAVIDQDVTLFEDTIADNIKMWDNSVEDFEMIMAARDAGLHEDIMMRNGGYRHKLTEGGRDLSGGQRQRLEIARALAQDPTICILDEATSALDAKTEFEVVKSICDRGITCIIIAHRLSTIRDCDEIIVLNNGEVVERGTHKELYKKGGAYTELVSSD